MSMRSAASCGHPFAVSAEPRGARTGRGPDVTLCLRPSRPTPTDRPSLQFPDRALDLGEETAAGYQPMHRFDLRRQVAVGTHATDDIADGRERRSGARGGPERRAEVERAGGSEHLDREHAREAVHRAPE